jgi:adenine/guanine phosphoribosyltransferase-like PRPP-binding protein
MLKAADSLVDFHGTFNVHYGGKSGWVKKDGYWIYNFNAFVPVAECMFDVLVSGISKQPVKMIKLEKKIRRALRRIIKNIEKIRLGAKPLVDYPITAAKIVFTLISRFIVPLKKKITRELQAHPLLILGPDDGASQYGWEAAQELKKYIRKRWDIDIEVYCGYMDKERISEDKTTIPPYILDCKGNKITKVADKDINDCWVFIIDDMTSSGGTLKNATWVLVRQMGFSWQRIWPGVVHAILSKGLKPFETGCDKKSIKIAERPKRDFIIEDKENNRFEMPPRRFFTTNSVALPKSTEGSTVSMAPRVSIGPLVSYAVKRIVGETKY